MPLAILGFAGVTAMDARIADVTVSVVFPEILPDVAVMVVEPALTAVASPEALIVAFAASDELHVTDAVMSCVLPSE